MKFRFRAKSTDGKNAEAVQSPLSFIILPGLLILLGLVLKIVRIKRLKDLVPLILINILKVR